MVEWFLIWVRKHGFVPFAIYRIILGIILLVFGAEFAGRLGGQEISLRVALRSKRLKFLIRFPIAERAVGFADVTPGFF